MNPPPHSASGHPLPLGGEGWGEGAVQGEGMLKGAPEFAGRVSVPLWRTKFMKTSCTRPRQTRAHQPFNLFHNCCSVRKLAGCLSFLGRSVKGFSLRSSLGSISGPRVVDGGPPTTSPLVPDRGEDKREESNAFLFPSRW